MIAFVRGRVAEVGAEVAVLDVGGVGLALQCTPGTLAGLRVGDSTQLATSLVVREDSLTLFGFGDADERAVFEQVQTVTGVGPRLAQSLLATLTPDELRRAVATEDLTALMKVPGVGKKGAQRLVLELRDRLGGLAAAELAAAAPTGPGADGAPWRAQVHAGLTSLGWSAKEADAAVDAVAASHAEALDSAAPPDVGTLLRAALASLDRA